VVEPVEYAPSVVNAWQRIAVRWAPPPRLTVSEFADRELIVTSGPLAGTRWRSDYAPYQPGIMNAFHEPGVEIVVIQSSAQVGKTSMELAVCAYHVKHDPCSILVVLPTVQPMAEDFSKNRLDPLIAASPGLAELFTTKRKKDSSNTILLKTYRGGALAIAGANSAASLAARTVRLLLCDELDRWPAELKGEGATLAVAMKRTQAFRGRRRIMLVSTPTVKGAPIDVWYHRGDMREFQIPCPSCDESFAFKWRHIRWVHEDPSTARLHCPECDYGMDDTERLAALTGGEWISTNPNPERGVVSFHLWEAQSPFASLTDIVAGFLRARAIQKAGDPAEMHTWQNTTLAEARDLEDSKPVDDDAMLQLAETYAADVPAGACVLTMGVDTQDESLVALVLGWGPGEECWLIDWRVILGDTSQPEPWKQLDALLEQRYLHANGERLPIEATCIDSGGHRTTTVYEWGRRHLARKVFVIIGRDGPRPITSAPSPRRWGRGERKIPLYTIGVDAAKKLLADRIALRMAPPPADGEEQQPGPKVDDVIARGIPHWPKAIWFDKTFVKQLMSERLVTRYQKGVPSQVWKKIHPRNEPWDCAVYGLGALRLLRPDLNALAALRATPRPPQPPVPTPAAEKKTWIPKRGGSWLKGRR
jgi:phage terminase large subunit GpA-like protein